MKEQVSSLSTISKSDRAHMRSVEGLSMFKIPAHFMTIYHKIFNYKMTKAGKKGLSPVGPLKTGKV